MSILTDSILSSKASAISAYSKLIGVKVCIIVLVYFEFRNVGQLLLILIFIFPIFEYS